MTSATLCQLDVLPEEGSSFAKKPDFSIRKLRLDATDTNELTYFVTHKLRRRAGHAVG